MRKPLRREWTRVRLPDGSLFYSSHVSEYFAVQVWREGSGWHWVAVGFSNEFDAPLIAKHGTAGTMNEAQWYAEQWLPEDAPGEQLLWVT